MRGLAIVAVVVAVAACRPAASPPLAPAGSPDDDGVGALARLSGRLEVAGGDDDDDGGGAMSMAKVGGVRVRGGRALQRRPCSPTRCATIDTAIAAVPGRASIRRIGSPGWIRRGRSSERGAARKAV